MEENLIVMSLVRVFVTGQLVLPNPHRKRKYTEQLPPTHKADVPKKNLPSDQE